MLTEAPNQPKSLLTLHALNVRSLYRCCHIIFGKVLSTQLIFCICNACAFLGQADIGEGGAAAGASLAAHLHAGAPHAAALLFLQTDPPAVTEVALAGSAPPPAAGALLDPGPVPGLSHLPL